MLTPSLTEYLPWTTLAEADAETTHQLSTIKKNNSSLVIQRGFVLAFHNQSSCHLVLVQPLVVTMGRTTRSSSRKSEDKTVAAIAKPAAASKKKVVVKKKESPVKKSAPSTTKAASSGTVVSIEACKQWGAFKSRAAKIEKAVGSKATVKINEEKVG